MPGMNENSTVVKPRQGIAKAAEYLVAQGRNGDDALAHVTIGETIIPSEIFDKNPSLKESLNAAFDAENVDMNQYVVGSGIMSVNPETGLYEAGWLKKTFRSVKKVVKEAGPIIGAVIGGMVGGPIGASIGAGIGTKTSAMPKEDIMRNMAIAYGGANALQGAGIGGASASANSAASRAGGWFGGGMSEGIGSFFSSANWTPMAGGQAGVGGFFQNIGSGAARNFGLGGTMPLSDPSLGLSSTQQKKIAAEMAATGADAHTAAMSLGITDPTILSNLGSVAPGVIGPGVISSGIGSYASLNPLQQFALQTGFDAATGIMEEDGSSSSGTMPQPAYLGRSLSSGPAIGNLGNTGVGSGNMSALNPMNNATSSISNTYAPENSPSFGSAVAATTRGNELLDLLSGRMSRTDEAGPPELLSLTSPFPVFDTPRFTAKDGGFVGSNRAMFANGGKVFEGGGYVQGPGGEKEDMINAKLSNNEFVMTADAVRGAGNGSIREGADKMYNLMNNFERRA
tara:strand:+ start:3758 stop:5293 length:1536 start_codon:yes stop_codon:yes gene_type:complete